MIVGQVDISTGGSRFSPGASVRSYFYSRDERPHVLMVSRRCCIRVLKDVLALKARGWRVDSLSERAPALPSAFDAVIVAGMYRFADIIAASGASIIHVHNEPDFLMRYADIGARGRPIVYDCHDLEYMRHGEVRDDERFAFARADAIVNVGERYRDAAWGLHPWRCPDAVVRSLPVKRLAPVANAPRSGIVYQGGASTGEVPWRDYTVTAKTLAQRGWPLHMYIRDEVADYYAALGAVPSGWRPYAEMLGELTRYTFGFVGLDKPHEAHENASPNKLFEYAAAGVIPAICNMPGLAEEFGHDACVHADSVDRLVDAMESCDVNAKRAAALARVEWMDDEVAKLEALYAQL